jgi:hypothetical protein
MKPNIRRATALVALLALAAVPAMAAANQPSTVPPENQGTAHRHQASQPQGPNYNPAGNPNNGNPGPKASLPEKAKAYGVYCRNESKQHVAGQKGTPFSQCVTAMAKLKQANSGGSEENSLSPGQACKAESKKHVAGQKGTPFSQCVTAAAKMRHHEQHTEGKDG